MNISDTYPSAYTYSLTIEEAYALRSAAAFVADTTPDVFIEAACLIVNDALETTVDQRKAGWEAAFDFVIPYPHDALRALAPMLLAQSDNIKYPDALRTGVEIITA